MCVSIYVYTYIHIRYPCICVYIYIYMCKDIHIYIYNTLQEFTVSSRNQLFPPGHVPNSNMSRLPLPEQATTLVTRNRHFCKGRSLLPNRSGRVKLVEIAEQDFRKKK